MKTRGLAGEDAIEGGEMSSLKGLFNVIKQEPIFINMGI
ncbi:hypothetical protein NBG4_420023 [Candidatus Sulfobium mesophilum]|jgi:hypothetical protein|uniref:Uncharacterized protein n=1 Tax=Candidatus Sulfobium mesophilum TaxID=2016548 RepID=A0A2U3QIA4_9BACT|nr:hypothetical protein NBG4_420023 [Candidatus Sulfobium mesophilum]